MTGSELKELRRRAGYKTQEEFAKELGVSRVSVSNWERKRGHQIPPSAAKKIQAALAEPVEKRGGFEVMQCPWCYKAMQICISEDRADYVCRHCNNDVRYRRERGLIRLA